jgi:phosphoinositide-3-kinase regulatory subunit 4
MVTSWNWLFLTDFASYKPTYLPADNPVSAQLDFQQLHSQTCQLFECKAQQVEHQNWLFL